MKYDITFQEIIRLDPCKFFSTFVTMQLPRNGAAGCRQVSQCDGTPRLSRPLNLLLEPGAPQCCGFCGRVDFITFLPVLGRLLRGGSPAAAQRPFYGALISAGVVYALSAAVIRRDGNDNSLLDFLAAACAARAPDPLRARLMDDTKQRDEERREDDGRPTRPGHGAKSSEKRP